MTSSVDFFVYAEDWLDWLKHLSFLNPWIIVKHQLYFDVNIKETHTSVDEKNINSSVLIYVPLNLHIP